MTSNRVFVLAGMMLAVLHGSACGWSVVSGQWRPDANTYAKRQAWETTVWREGWDEEQFYPKYWTPSGSLHMILRNDSKRPDSIRLTHVDKQPIEKLATTPTFAGRVIWYRVCSPRVAVTETTGMSLDRQEKAPPGEWVECSIRFREPPKETVWLTFVAGDGQALEIPVLISPPRVRLEAISFSPSIDRVYIYVRALDRKPLGKGKVLLDGRDCTAAMRWAQGPGGSGLAVAEVKLGRAWDYGSHHLVEVRTADGEALAQPVRAWDNYFAIGLFGTVEEARVKAAKEHGFNTYVAQPSDMLDAAGMNCIPSVASGGGSKRGAGGTGVLFLLNHDEPDAHDWKAGEKLPFYQRIGVNAQSQTLPTIRDQRKADPTAPNVVLVNNSFKPANWYVYGQIPDILCTDPYVPFRHRQVDQVWCSLEPARDASTPRPLLSVHWACNLKAKNEPERGNAPTPEEERMGVFYALGCGVKGILYFIDMSPAQGKSNFTGLTDLPELYAEIGRINKDVAALAPYLSLSCPAGAPANQGRAWVRSLMCGADTMLVVAVNTDHFIDFSASGRGSRHSPVKNAMIQVTLPPHFKKCSVREIKDGQLVPFKADIKGVNLKLALDELSTARAFVISR